MSDYVSIGDILVRVNECFEKWRGTCKIEQHGSLADQPSMVCWSCSECGFGWHHSINDRQFSYCPNCGRKVVES